MLFFVKVLTIMLIADISISKSAIDPETNLMIPNSWDNYYVELYNNEVILVGFYDSKDSGEIAENVMTTLTYLRGTKYLDTKEIPVMAVDMALIPKIKSFYDFEKNTHLWLFVRNRAYKMKDFGEIMIRSSTDSVVSDTYNWTVEQVDGLIKEVTCPSEFDEYVQKHGVVTVYLGDRNQNFKSFRKWILQFSKNPIFAVFDPEVIQKVLEKWDSQMISKLNENEDMMAVIWADDKLTEMDNTNFVMNSDFDDEKNMTLFYLYETENKIRNETPTSDNVFLMYQRNLPLFLFNYSEDSQSGSRLKQLHQAIKILPKRFIYDLFEHDSPRAIDYQHIMIQSHGYKLIEPNSIYIVWLTHGTRPQILKFDQAFNTNEIVAWTFKFSEMFPTLFGNKREVQKSDKIETEEL